MRGRAAMRGYTVEDLVVACSALPQTYEVVWEADDVVPVHTFRIEVDETAQRVTFTAWE